jgi:hypothetical protein
MVFSIGGLRFGTVLGTIYGMDTSEKVRENRLRRMADRQGWRLVRKRSYDPRALDYGTYRLEPVPGKRQGDVVGPLSIDEVEERLTS